jgi:hypothetical protein
MLVLFKYLGLTKELFQPELNIEVKPPGSASFTPGPESPPRMSTLPEQIDCLCWPEPLASRGLGPATLQRLYVFALVAYRFEYHRV